MESEPGSGTAVNVRLPLARETSRAGASATPGTDDDAAPPALVPDRGEGDPAASSTEADHHRPGGRATA